MINVVKKINGIDKVSVGSEDFSPSEYIQNLLDQLKNDVFPLFNGTPFFTIARNTFCFIDHVSALKFGITSDRGEQTARIKKLLGEFATFDPYINEKYKRYAGFITQVYRHDLVHNIRPFPHKIKVIDKNGNQSIQVSWFAVTHQTKKDLPKPATFESLSEYFSSTRNRSGLCHLRYCGNQIVINNFCLFFDLISFMKEYKSILDTDPDQQKLFISNYQLIVNKYPNITDFILDKAKDKECTFN